jgi:hypothetical protein
MAARSGVVFPVSMADILAETVEICFGSFTATSTTLAAATSPAAFVEAPSTLDAAPAPAKSRRPTRPNPMTSSRGWSVSLTRWRKPYISARELSAQRRMRRTVGPSHSVCDLPATFTHYRRPSRSGSNLGDRNHLTTSRSNFAHVVTLSTYYASTTRVHDTRSVTADCGRISTRSATSCALRMLPRLRMAVSSRRPGSTSPTTRDLPGGASWWSPRTTHHGLARRIPRRHVKSKPTQTAPRGGRRSSARRYPCVPATCASSSKRRGSRRSTAPKTTWVRR